MTLQESVTKRENELRNARIKTRLIAGVLFVMFLILLGVCVPEMTTVIKHDDPILGGFLGWEETQYNGGYIAVVMISIIGVAFAGSTLLTDVLLCRYKTIEVGGNYITVSGAFTKSVVYVNGEEVGRVKLFTFNPAVEFALPNGVKASVVFVHRNIFRMAHISFSDDTPSVDL